MKLLPENQEERFRWEAGQEILALRAEVQRLRDLLFACGMRECDCCGKIKPDVRMVSLPHVGDTNACEDCRNPEKWHQRT